MRTACPFGGSCGTDVQGSPGLDGELEPVKEDIFALHLTNGGVSRVEVPMTVFIFIVFIVLRYGHMFIVVSLHSSSLSVGRDWTHVLPR